MSKKTTNIFCLGNQLYYNDRADLPGKNIKVARKSIVARLEIKAGEKFTTKNLTIKRPGNGIPANEYFNLIGRKSKRIFKKDEIITK